MSTSSPVPSIARQTPLSSSLPAGDPAPQTAEPALSSTSSLATQVQTPSLLQQALPLRTDSEPARPARAGKPTLAPADVPAPSAQGQTRPAVIQQQQQQVGDGKGRQPDAFDGEVIEDEDVIGFDGHPAVGPRLFNSENSVRKPIAAQLDKTMAGLVRDTSSNPLIAAKFHVTFGKQLRDNGEHQDALRYFRSALKYQQAQHDAAPHKTAKIHRLIAEALCKQSNYAEALAQFQECLKIQQRISGIDHADTAGIDCQIGDVYGNMGNYGHALVYFRLALSIYTKKLDIDDDRIAYVYNQIGIVLNDQGDVAGAVQHYQDALAVLERKLGTEHPNLASLYHNYAVFLDSLGRHDEAQSYRSREKVIRKNHS